MPVTLTTHADEESTYKITVSFTDAAGSAVTPNIITYTLTDINGTVINSKSNVSVSPASSIDIVLSGDDLALQSGETVIAERVLTIVADYDSDEGSGLPLNEEAHFYIDDLTNIS